MTPDALAALYRECGASFADMQPGNAVRMVFGNGLSQRPPLMLIGEAPGEQETLQGKPFVGKAGKNLNTFLETVGLARDSLYITNVVKFRPTRQSAAGRTVNRPPTRAEIAWHLPWLYREIMLVAPRTLVTLGNVALNAFWPGVTIGEYHGRWTEAAVHTEGFPAITCPLFPLYHPASVIYNRSLAPVYQDDLCVLRSTLAQAGVHTDG
ncbi:MAG: uracil-DNA glycosylase [Eubacteriales bacterium]|nr:uracil-DNA glycosylase [Eubacteriales bacterium]